MILKRGFVLLTVLWVIIGIGVLAFTASFAAKSATYSAHNRIALSQAEWKARGCIERVRATAHDAMSSVSPDAVIDVWDSLDRVITHSPLLIGTTCKVELTANSAGVDINTASEDQLFSWLQALGIYEYKADSMVSALLDWRDSDNISHPNGAESDWYRMNNRKQPRNDRLQAPEELLYVRGFEDFSDYLYMIRVNPGRMPLSHTPLEVLAAYPGFTSEVIANTALQRQRGERVRELLVLGANVSSSARDTLMAHYAELSRITTVETEGWIVRASTSLGDASQIEVSLSVRLARAGVRVAVMERW